MRSGVGCPALCSSWRWLTAGAYGLHKGTRMQRCFSTTTTHPPAPGGSQETCSAPALGRFAFCVLVHSSIYAAFYHPLHSWAKLNYRLGERKNITFSLRWAHVLSQLHNYVWWGFLSLLSKFLLLTSLLCCFHHYWTLKLMSHELLSQEVTLNLA